LPSVNERSLGGYFTKAAAAAMEKTGANALDEKVCRKDAIKKDLDDWLVRLLCGSFSKND
jgi:hypothetical protein